MKVLTDDKALELTERLLQNDKDIKDELESKIPKVDEFVTKSYVTHAIASAQLSGGGSGNSNIDLSNYALKNHTHAEYLTEHQNLDAYAKKTDVPDISGLASTAYVDTAIQNVNVDLTRYATESFVTNSIANAQLSGGEVDLSGYALKTEIPSIDGLATESYVNEAISQAQFNSGENRNEITTSVTQGYRDTLVIPDKYNTGYKGELISMSEYFGSYYTEGSALYITSALQKALGTVYENIDFVDVINLNKTGLSSMTFKNCKFSASATYNVALGTNFETNNIEVVFENCEFMNSTGACVQSGSRIKMINCKIHDCAQDGGKVYDYGSYENCYFYNFGYAEGAHADGIQVSNTNHDFSIINCRFDMPYYDKYVPNAAIFFVLEGENDSYNPTIKDCVMTGGNYTFYYGYKGDATVNIIENSTVENILVGCSYKFGQLNDVSGTINREEIKTANTLFVSSVYKEDGKTKLLVTNYTNTERTLKVVTNNGETNYTIPACPLCDEWAAYTSLSEFPFDIEYSLEEDVDYIVCYDGDEQIRFVDFVGNGVSDGTSNYATKEDLANYALKSEISSITAINLVTDSNGAIVSGTATLSDNSTIEINITTI